MPLISTIAELRNYISIDANAKIKTFMPYIQEAEEVYIIDLLGKAFYDELVTMYNNQAVLDADYTALFQYLQRCLSYYTQLLAIPHLAVSFGDNGMRQNRSDESDTAPRWVQEKLLFNALKNGDIHADKLLEFLETKSSAIKFSTWYSSEANTKNSGYIVYATSVANKHISINNSRRVFLTLRQKLREIETRLIPKLIGSAQYSELVSQLKANNVSNENASLLGKIEPIVCKRALSMQLPFMSVQINENGIFIYSGTDDLFKLGQLAGDAQVKTLCQQLKDGELGYLSDEQELRQYILDNIDLYPLIKTSGVYTVQPDPGPTWRPINDSNSTHFIA